MGRGPLGELAVSEQVRVVSILHVWEADELVGVVVWGPRGYVKLCGSPEQGFSFLAAEFKAIVNKELALKSFATFKVIRRSGRAVDLSSETSGAMLAIKDADGEDYLGFDVSGKLVTSSRDLDTATEMVVASAPPSSDGLRI